MNAEQPPTVLYSFQQPRPTTNPYITQLLQSMEQRVTAQTFNWRTALTGHYDVFHIHWPEVLMRGQTRAKQRARTAMFALLLARLRASREKAVVRTIHNVKPHEELSPSQRRLQRALDRRTDYWIRLNERTPTPSPDRTVTIVHGHYIDWFAPYPRAKPEPGRVVMFGQLRPYKGVEDLIAAAAEVTRPDFRLTILGAAITEDYGTSLIEAAEADPRITLRLGFATDAELTAEISRASLIILPYRDMLNSGALLLGLSLARPALVPGNPSNDDLAAEVGPQWVMRYPDGITAEEIETALARAEQLLQDTGEPDLTRRGWQESTEAHLTAYREALRVRRGQAS